MEAWNKFTTFIEGKYGIETTNKWVHTLKIIRFDACNIFLQCKDYFQSQWIEEHILPLAKDHFLDGNGKRIKIHILTGEGKTKKKSEVKESLIKFCSDLISPRSTLDDYIPSVENQFTHRALQKIFSFDVITKKLSQMPNDPPNPIYIHGPKGSGKTHLLMSIKAILDNHKLNTFYVDAETFTDHVIHAIRFGKMNTFRKTYRNIDALIIDNIEVLGRRHATQEEFFHTFNTLQTSGRMIILSSAFIPRKLDSIEERLISRFEWGILLNIEITKDRSIRNQILDNQLKFLHLKIDVATKDFLLEQFTTCHLLKSAIFLLSKESISQTINLSEARSILEKLIRQQIHDELNPEKILEEIAKTFGIRVIDMQSKSQTRDCVLPRQFAMYFLRHVLKLPFMKIGYIFKKDHSTVMTSIRHIEKNIEKNNEETLYYINAIKSALVKLQNNLEVNKIT